MQNLIECTGIIHYAQDNQVGIIVKHLGSERDNGCTIVQDDDHIEMNVLFELSLRCNSILPTIFSRKKRCHQNLGVIEYPLQAVTDLSLYILHLY